MLFSLLGVVVGLGVARLVLRLDPSVESMHTPGDPAETTLRAPPVRTGLLSSLFVYLAIAGVTTVLFALAGARYPEHAHVALAAAYVVVLVTCAFTDVMAYRVPNAITYPAIVLALVAGLTMPSARPIDVVMGGALAGAVLLIPSLVMRGQGIGMGDVKLALFVGLALGLSLTPVALIVTALLGGLTAATLLAFGIRHRQDIIPYAPFIAAGALTVLLWRGAAFGGVA
jgi:prepilin signal peptidase PulO-like enzyme (type II secretory pathway)